FLISQEERKNLIGVKTLSEYIVVHSDTISNKPFHSLYAGVDTNMLRQRFDSDKIFSYIAGREKKDLLKEMKPEIPRAPVRKRL
ncbi:hypothetical protein ACUODJ_45530, partial [Escherichia sp. HC-CC]